VIVSGGTATGKTTMMNVLSSFIPGGERVITIENAAELQLRQRHVISLESRPPNIEGRGEITIRDLVINTLRMRPDRIVVGEVRGGESLDMLQAMNTGHEGSMTTLHANDPEEALLRLQTMVLLAGTELPVWAILEQIAEAIQLIIHMDRGSDGSRRVVHIIEVQGREEERIRQETLFVFSEETGKLEPTGVVPEFLRRLRDHGVQVPTGIFSRESDTDSPELRAFVQRWTQTQEAEPSRPVLPGRLEWPERYRLADLVKRWIVGQISAGTTLNRGPEASAVVAKSVDAILHQEGLVLSRRDREDLHALVEAEVLGYGPMDVLLDEAEVTEIMVNGPESVYVEREGRIEETPVVFRDRAHLMRIVERILAPLGRRVDESNPMIDARLPDGSRVNVIIPPLSLIGPVLTVRKFEREPFTIDDLITFGTLTRDVSAFLGACIRGRLNVIVSGGTGTGKTTLLNVLSSFIPGDERIVTVENAAELQLRQRHVISLESRPPNIEGVGEITIRDLVINALRMRPDRIIVGEVRGGEALDMLQAMSTGASLTTLHANDPREALLRLETMVMLAGFDLPIRAIREQIALSIDFFVHLQRMPDGSRKVVKVTEIVGLKGREIVMQDIFAFRVKEVRGNEIVGTLVPTGVLPKGLAKLQRRKIDLDRRLFAPPPAE
jgi:pilus assembly protein CpaF